MRYTDLIFDLYGTLLDIHTEENDLVWEKTALYFGFYGAHYTGRALRAAFQKALAARQAQAGQAYECFPDIAMEGIFCQLFQDQGVCRNSQALGVNAAQLFRISSISYLRLYPAVSEALAQLRQAGFRLWLLSNAQAIFTTCELRLVGLEGVFDGVYLSSDYGCRKPDGRFFRALLEEKQLDPAHCLMIGNDLQTDIAGARQVGLATMYLHTNLTPQEQRPADPACHPALAGPDCRHYEYEGCDWEELTRILCRL